jgi:hypothetical protein
MPLAMKNRAVIGHEKQSCHPERSEGSASLPTEIVIPTAA